jgi:hypothetical protein
MSKAPVTDPLAKPVEAASFTPGPWKCGPFQNRESEISASLWKSFAVVFGNSDPDLNNQGKANARLIAAAPDLLAACQTAKKALAHVASEFGLEAEVKQLEDAIKKARGQ